MVMLVDDLFLFFFPRGMPIVVLYLSDNTPCLYSLGMYFNLRDPIGKPKYSFKYSRINFYFY